MAKRVLMVLTNHGGVEGTDVKTGWYLPECAHPYHRFSKAGYNIDFASIKGGACPVTPSSLDMNDAENREFWESAESRAYTENTKVLSDLNAADYDLVFFVGGFGTMWDFPFDNNLASFAQRVYETGGVVGAVCHGPIALANVKLSNGDYLVKGKEVAAFCNEEEAVAGLVSQLPEHKGLGRTCEDILSARGALYTKAAPWTAHVASSERLFTGQNPASAGPVADAIIAALSSY
ncbi:type 1 glutamine amidotransferase domain-containing protein [archaeon]|nr:MAG: type 1 glutamine amidotransferase domain-containing protein [archaeon]